MGARRRDLIASRRRTADDDEEGLNGTGDVEDDSLSDGSVTDVGDDADAEASDHSEVEKSTTNGHLKVNGRKGPVIVNGNSTQEPAVVPGTVFEASADTVAMLNGLKLSDNQEVEEVQFDNAAEGTEQPATQESVAEDQSTTTTQQETLFERRRREHEEYKKKRDADPAFVPNRGGFFMHDHRSAAAGPNGFRPSIRGRGRGRGGINMPFSPTAYGPTLFHLT
jgi:hypothetical protein